MLSGALPQVEFFSTSPALFVENQGQWADASVRYFHQGTAANVGMTDAGVAFQVFRHEPQNDTAAEQAATSLARFRKDRLGVQPVSTEMLQFSAEFVGAASVQPIGLQPSDTHFNYFIGDEADWRSDVPSYEIVAYQGLYDGIDLHTWGLRSSLKYEFHVAPGADWSQIQVRYDGIAGLSLTDDGELAVALEDGWGQWVDDAPYIYQMIDGQQVEVAGRFELVDDVTYTFAVTGPYDVNTPLIIDPDLAWSTYLGGGSKDVAYDVAIDTAGNLFVSGETRSSGWVGSISRTVAFVVKMTPTGVTEWGTYYGPSNSHLGYTIALDNSNNIIVAGENMSSEDSSRAFVAKMSPTGELQHTASLNFLDVDLVVGVAVDSANNVLVAGASGSQSSSNGFVQKLSPTLSSIRKHNVGDYAAGVAVDAADNVFVSGEISSNALVRKLNPELTSTLWTHYLGGSGAYAMGIDVDAVGNALVTGYTESSGWTSGGYDTSYGGNGDAFVAKLDKDSGARTWSTYLGGGQQDIGWNLTVDNAGDVFVSGETKSSGWVSGGYDTSYKGNKDAFLAKLSSTGDHIWSTYLGGSQDDIGWSVAVDGNGGIVLVGETQSSGWIPGSYGGNTDGFVVKLAAVNQPPEIASLSGTPDPVTRPANLTLLAAGVSDPDGEVVQVVFYRDTNGDGHWDEGDEPLGPGEVGVDGWTWTGSTAGWTLGSHTFFARAEDDKEEWSDPVTTTVVVQNAVPVVGSLPIPPPAAATRPAAVTLMADGVSDADGSIVQVAFYRDTNGNGQWDAGDALLGTDDNGADGWTWTGSTAGWTVGSQTVFARAQDNDLAWSAPVSAVVQIENALPVVDSLSATPDPVTRSADLTLTAHGVTDPDGSVARVEFYRDTNGDHQWDANDELLGADQNGADGWSWTASTAGWTLGQHTFFARVQDSDGAWSGAVSITAVVQNAAPVVSFSSQRNPVPQSADLTLTALVHDPDGEVEQVEFYRDTNGNGEWDAGDTLIVASESGDDEWTWTENTAGWPLGPYAFFARAKDDEELWSEPVAVIVWVAYWQNLKNPNDINGDGVVNASDVLTLINAINRGDDGQLPPRGPGNLHWPFYDVSGNGSLAPLDVLMVINTINQAAAPSPPAGEGEGTMPQWPNEYQPLPTVGSAIDDEVETSLWDGQPGSTDKWHLAAADNRTMIPWQALSDDEVETLLDDQLLADLALDVYSAAWR